MSDESINLFVSNVLSGMLKKAEETLSRDKFYALLLDTQKRMKRTMEDLASFPAGPLRALAMHTRIDRAIRSWREHDLLAGSSACHKCTLSGCCHTQVDVTMDEAKLLVKNHRDKIDLRLLAAQQVPDMESSIRTDDDNRPRIDAYGKLSYEDRACVFLKGGRCSVYEDRPMVCRKWYIYDDPNTCSDWSHTGPIAAIIGAEIITSAAFSRWPSSRLPTLLQKVLDQLKETNGKEA